MLPTIKTEPESPTTANADIDDESLGSPEGLAPARPCETPKGFTDEEWQDLTKVIILVYYHS